MAKITNSAGYPVVAGTSTAGTLAATDTLHQLTSGDSHPSDHVKPGSGGGGTK